jgi:hypothetical protein
MFLILSGIQECNLADDSNWNIKDIYLTDCRIELYLLVYRCGLLSEEQKNGIRGIRC